MGRNSVTNPDSGSDDPTTATPSTTGYSIRDRFPFKRSNNNTIPVSRSSKTQTSSHKHFRSHYQKSLTRKLRLFPFKGKSLFYLCVFSVIFSFALWSMVLQSSIMSVFRQGVGSERMKWRWSVKEGLKLGSSLEFKPRLRIELNESQLDQLRAQPRIGIRRPRIGLILGNMGKDPSSLMLYTVMKNLQDLGYMLKIFAVKDGEARSIWEGIGGHVSILSAERYGYIDWSIFEGIVADSLEVKDAISSLMQEPFCSVPLLWIIQEDTLANRLQVYETMGWDHLISSWKVAFSRADVVVFPHFSLPMLYSVLDSGNFFVIPGSPIDVWAAEAYFKTHTKSQLREENGFSEDDLLVLVVGSSFFYDDLAWDYAVSMRDIEPLLVEYAGMKHVGESKFIFVCGNSSNAYSDALQDVATRLGLYQGSVWHYGMDNDVNSLMLMTDVLLYGSSQDEQEFPPLLTRAMSFGIPVVAPDYPVIRKYVIGGVHGMIFPQHNSAELINAFSHLIPEGKLSKLAHTIASSGRLHVKNMMAAECITSFAKLIENVLHFPSDVLMPSYASQLRQSSWEWDLFEKETEQKASNTENLMDSSEVRSNIVYDLEEDMANLTPYKNVSGEESEMLEDDIPTKLDWDILDEMESSEEVERVEMEEIDERMEKDIGEWDEIYRNARKSEKLRFETNERDEGELERTGQPVCIYEIYNGAGGWPFLHHGSLYRGLSLSTKARRLKSDDVDAVSRLPILNETYYRDILCEVGGMFSIANEVDDIHKRPWIGFQSWRASGRKASLSIKAERVLEQTIQENSKGDTIYFWARLDMNRGPVESNDLLTFWSTCDIMNGGKCRTAFEDAFHQMYDLPLSVEALPPMPEDGGHWSALHSWVMPTPSFLEFIMFSRMFVDSLNYLHVNSSKTPECMLGVSTLEKKHCYCRLLELVVNIWAYHSGRKMVYIDPHSGLLEEQHPIERRKGFMWAKYFDPTLLKSMDEDLAEAADDNDHPYRTWLWPLTGEVYWQGIYEREREERYRLKMDKKRKTKEKLLERMMKGYKQKSLGG